VPQLGWEYGASIRKGRLYVKVHGDDSAAPDTLERR